MPNIRSTGIFADDATGLHRGTYAAATKTKVPGVPIEYLAAKEWRSHYVEFQEAQDLTNLVVTDVGTVTDETIFQDADGDTHGLFTHNTANEGFNIQKAVGGFLPTANRVIVYETVVASDDWTETDWFIGLMEVDTTPMAATGLLLANGADNCAGFHSLDSSAVVNFKTCGIAFANIVTTAVGAGVNSVGQTLAADTLVDGEYARFGIRIEGVSAVEYYLNNKLVHTLTADDDLAEVVVPSWSHLAGGAEEKFRIKSYYFGQSR